MPNKTKKVNRPSKETLISDLQIIKKKNKIADKYGVSRTAVYQWISAYGISEQDTGKKETSKDNAKGKKKSKYGAIRPESRRTMYELKIYAEQILPPGSFEPRKEKELEKVKKLFDDETQKRLIKEFTSKERSKAEAIGLFKKSVEEQIEISVQHSLGELAMKELEKKVASIDPDDNMKVFVFYHDCDLTENEENVFKISYLKPHIHIYVVVPKKNEKRVTMRFCKVLSNLGIKLREGKDDEIWKYGIRGIDNISKALAYGTHETEAAQKDGKHVYPLDSTHVITNDPDYLKTQRALYFATVHPHDENNWNKKTRKQLFEQLGEEARALGRTGGNLDKWEDTLPIDVLSDRRMNAVIKRYWSGFNELVNSTDKIKRVVIFIEGPGKVGKTTTSRLTLNQLGVNNEDIIFIDHKGTGKMDKILPSTKAIIFDDMGYDDLYGLFDQKPCGTYRRNSGDRFFIGNYVIITFNGSFEKWLNDCCKIEIAKMSQNEFDALKSRVFICQMEKVEDYWQLKLIKKACRSTKEYDEDLLQMFGEFQIKFNEISSEYIPSDEKELADDSYDNHFIYKHERPSHLNENLPQCKKPDSYGQKLWGGFFVKYSDGSMEDLKGDELNQLKQLKQLFPDDLSLDKQINKEILEGQKKIGLQADTENPKIKIRVEHHPNPDDVPF